MRGELERALDRGARVLRIGADQDDLADIAVFNALLGLCIGIVKAAHEAEHEHLVRVGFHSLLRLLALFDRGIERLVAEYMLACVERQLDVVCMVHGRGYDHDRVQLGVFDHLRYVRVGVGDAQLRSDLLDALFIHVTQRGQLRTGNQVGDIAGVLKAKAAEADGTDFYLFHDNYSFIHLISYMFIAQAYSAGLSIIFTFSGFPVLRESITASAATQAA